MQQNFNSVVDFSERFFETVTILRVRRAIDFRVHENEQKIVPLRKSFVSAHGFVFEDPRGCVLATPGKKTVTLTGENEVVVGILPKFSEFV